MKTSIVLKEERSDIISQLESIKDVATTEERDLSSEENNQVDGLLTEVDSLDTKIERAENGGIQWCDWNWTPLVRLESNGAIEW